MIYVHIALLTPQDASGVLSVRAADQTEIYAPRVFLAPASSSISDVPQASVSAESLSTLCAIREVIPMAGASVADIREYGRYGFIVLETLEDEPSMRRQLTIHGGNTDSDGRLKPSPTALRLSNHDMRELVRLITQLGKHEFSVICSNLELLPSAQDPHSTSAARPYFKFQALPGWVAAAVPFVAASAAYADCSQYDSGTSFSAVDFGYLLIDEGGYLLSGYVPDNNSGVTIAGGLDLGLQTSSNLLQMGFSQTQVTAWAPYLATSSSQPLIGAAARSALAKNPLTVTQTAAAQINNTYYTWVANTVGAAYNASVKSLGKLPGVTFSSLPAAWQTAMADMYLIYPGFVSTACFTQLASGEWSTAVATLQKFNGPTVTVNERAKSNGEYLSTKLTGLPT